MDVLYKHSSVIHNTKAAEVIIPLLQQYLSPFFSVLDVGCGIGTWLKVIMDKCQLTDCMGLDGSYTKRDLLLIPEDKFRQCDLRQKFDMGRSFDLLICTEVAEHLPASCAETFIDSLCAHSSTIVFSSAIPGQGGQSHLNEQWPDYWEKKFSERGFTRLDIIRPLIWDNPLVDVWYRQNLYVFTSNRLEVREYASFVRAEIHPDLWAHKINALHAATSEIDSFEKGGAGILRSWKALLAAIINKYTWRQS